MHRKLIIAALCAFAMLMAAAAQASLVPAPLYWPTNGHYYSAITFSGTWDQANADAQTRSYNGAPGHLATLTTQAEYDFARTVYDTFGWSWGIAWIVNLDSVNHTLTIQ